MPDVVIFENFKMDELNANVVQRESVSIVEKLIAIWGTGLLNSWSIGVLISDHSLIKCRSK